MYFHIIYYKDLICSLFLFLLEFIMNSLASSLCERTEERITVGGQASFETKKTTYTGMSETSVAESKYHG